MSSMRSDWKEVRLGDYISIKSGLAYQGSKIGHGDALLLGMGCVSFKDKFVYDGARPYDDNSINDSYCVLPGDIVLATRQQSDNLPILAMPAIIPEDLNSKKIIFGTNLYKIENNSEISNKFIYWLLKHQHYVAYISGIKSGTAVQMVTKKNIEKYKFLCPPYEQREKIAESLWNYDQLIENNNKRIKILEDMAESLYKEWFVRFRNPLQRKKIGKVNDLCSIKSGFAFKSDDWQETGSKVVKIKDLDGDFVNTNNLDCVSEEVAKKAIKFRLNTGDLTIAMTGATIGKIGIVKDDNLYTNQRVGKFFVDKKYVPYLYCFFKQEHIVETVIVFSGSSAAQPNISGENLEKIDMPFDKELIDKFSVVVNPVFNEIITLLKRNDYLIQQRDALLPRLMSGKLEV